MLCHGDNISSRVDSGGSFRGVPALVVNQSVMGDGRLPPFLCDERGTVIVGLTPISILIHFLFNSCVRSKCMIDVQSYSYR